MTSPMASLNFMRPEYSRLERLLDIAILHQEQGHPERALEPLERYLMWNPQDQHAAAVKEEIVRALGR